MKIALVDFDMTGFPNLALMKLAASHRGKGDDVLPVNFIMGADLVYGSCVFPKNAVRSQLPAEAVVGGTGFSLETWLPQEVEHIMPDYSLYGLDFSLGFTTRGCCRNCPWCVVPHKEGKIRDWTSFYEFWDRRYRKIMLLDNNLLAAPSCKQTLEALITERIAVDFNQGLDIRLVDEEIAGLLARVRKWKELRFSFDSLALETQVRKGVAFLVEAGIPATQLMFFALIGYWPPHDDYARLRLLGELKVAVFPMNYQPIGDGPSAAPLLTAGETWTNDPILFRGPRRTYQKALRLIKARMGKSTSPDFGESRDER